jgi:hypothetical protein
MANRLSSPMSNHISKRNCGGCSLVSLIRERILSVLAGTVSADPDREAEFEDEEKVLAGRPDANMPALLTKDVPGG